MSRNERDWVLNRFFSSSSSSSRREGRFSQGILTNSSQRRTTCYCGWFNRYILRETFEQATDRNNPWLHTLNLEVWCTFCVRSVVFHARKSCWERRIFYIKLIYLSILVREVLKTMINYLGTLHFSLNDCCVCWCNFNLDCLPFCATVLNLIRGFSGFTTSLVMNLRTVSLLLVFILTIVYVLSELLSTVSIEICIMS
jgi:hypothetical protein